MEIEIQSKTNNPLLNRTEVNFIIHHDGEETPKRDLVRSELADKLKVKKENIMVSFMESSFGTNETLGYAKVYTSVEKAKTGEKKYILVRNAVIAAPKKTVKEEKKPAEKPEKKEEVAEKPEGEEKPAEETPAPKEEGAETSAEEKKEEPAEKPEGEEKKPEETPQPKEDAEKPKEEKKPAEEKKE